MPASSSSTPRAARCGSPPSECYSYGLRGFYRFLVRDLCLGGITLALMVGDAALRGEPGPLSMAVAVLAGAMAAMSGFLVHEWGHLAATFAAGGVAHPPTSLRAIFLFNFDVEKSTRAQFLAMSYGGYAATGLGVLLLLPWIDLGQISGVTALVLSTLGIGATLILEIPTTLRVARGGPLPTGGVYAGEPRS